MGCSRSWDGPSRCALLVAALFLAVPLASPAQVVRCTDPATGSVTYTDGPCASGQRRREVAPRQTPEEIRQEREQAEKALRLKREQREAQQGQDAPHEGSAPAARRHAAEDPARSPACLQARQTLQGLVSTLDPSLYDTRSRIDAAQHAADQACLHPAELARLQNRQAYRPAYEAPVYLPPVVVVPARPRPPQRAPEMVQCNVFRCYDRQGNSYPR